MNEFITEKEFEKRLLVLIKKWAENKVSDDEFTKQAQELIKHVPLRLGSFKDEELDWAKYWIDEINYYGLRTVQERHFDFVKFMQERINNN